MAEVVAIWSEDDEDDDLATKRAEKWRKTTALRDKGDGEAAAEWYAEQEWWDTRFDELAIFVRFDDGVVDEFGVEPDFDVSFITWKREPKSG
jgi:hypothetical protein